jgi:hypothetical protein
MAFNQDWLEALEGNDPIYMQYDELSISELELHGSLANYRFEVPRLYVHTPPLSPNRFS